MKLTAETSNPPTQAEEANALIALPASRYLNASDCGSGFDERYQGLDIMHQYSGQFC